MAWTEIPDSELLEGQPAKGITIQAIRDNFAAMASAASGAPKFVFDAFAAPVAGGTHIVWLSQIDGQEITQDPAGPSYNAIATAPPIRIAGTVRAYMESCKSSAGQAGFCRIALNGVTVQTFTNTTTTPTFTAFTVDIAVVPGDVISFLHAADDSTGGPISRNPRLYSSVNTIVTY